MTESAGRARLIEQLIADAQEAETQAGIFSRRNWGVLNEQGNVEVLPGLLDKLSVRLESIAKGLRAAAEALAGQEEAPQQKDDEEEDHARGGSVPGTEHGDLPHRTTGKP